MLTLARLMPGIGHALCQAVPRLGETGIISVVIKIHSLCTRGEPNSESEDLGSSLRCSGVMGIPVLIQVSALSL